MKKVSESWPRNTIFVRHSRSYDDPEPIELGFLESYDSKLVSCEMSILDARKLSETLDKVIRECEEFRAKHWSE